MALAALVLWAGGAVAGQSAAVFPFELDIKTTEEDFFIGEKKASPAEVARLERAHAEFVKALAADGRFQPVDLAPIAAEITAAQPIFLCNECDTDLAKKLGAELAFTVVIDKVSETHLNMIVTVRNAATGALVRNTQAVIQGNTDETWLHATRWILKNRLLAEGKVQ
jgi:hypothetical protein